MRILRVVFLSLVFFVPNTVLGDEGDAAAKAAGFVGSETCLECHTAQAVSGAHSAKTDPGSPAGQLGCETCHGPGAAHAKAEEEDAGSEEGSLAIKRLGAKSPLSFEERNGVCLSCHKETHIALWQGSTHERRDVACGDCHEVHKHDKNYLAEATETDLCVKCHKDVRADLWKNSHHPIREGKLQCSECHNAHGTVTDKLLTAVAINEKCYECHAEKRGPFLWEHEPVRENCLSCHTPHGSPHDKLLKGKIPFLCQECHSNARHPGTLYSVPSNAGDRSTYVTLNNRIFYRSCQNCHTQIHGSNHPSGSTFAR